MNAESEAIEHLRALIRMDTSNPGSTEAEAAVYVADVLARLGVTSEILEPEPGRCSVIARWPGLDGDLPALVVHGHLDVVPVGDLPWTRDPFGAEIAEGMVWGRGAVDMKASVAATLAAVGAFARGTHAPRRDLILAFFADEEMGSALGSRWAVEHRPDLFAGATEAIGEIGGFTVALPDGSRVYPVQVGERGMLWSRVTVEGPGGHAAWSSVANPVDRVAELIVRLRALGPVMDTAAAEAAVLPPGSLGDLISAGRGTSFVPTVMKAGSKLNVIPDTASLGIDCRFLPGDGDAALAAVRSILDPDMTLEILSFTPGASAPGTGPLIDACGDALRAADPDAVLLPYTLPASTDGQHLASLGIAPYGFSPLVIRSDFDVLSMFHAKDERIPVSAVREGTRVLLDFLQSY